MTFRTMAGKPIPTALLAAALTAGIAVSSAPAHADPAEPIQYTVTAVGESVVATLDGGTFAASGDSRSVEVRDSSGQVVDTIPLAVLVGEQRLGIEQRITAENRTLTLVPDLGALRLHVASPVASPLENQLALNDLASNLTRWPLIGTAVGTVLGAVLGGVIGLGTCLVIGPACLATVPAAIGAFAAAGGLTGTLVGGGAALADGLWKYLVTLQSAPGESPYANGDGLLDPNGTGVPDAQLRLPSGSAGGLRSGSASGSAGR
ncbi:hypothetical protein [Nocardia beijingensis]|uniref:hypothetical protein n=1 Tax=Nocardia beijingensis TaxID=95162 RepID=UPI00083490A4|nr:hypothetical protein [Nocardia beijingensis]